MLVALIYMYLQTQDYQHRRVPRAAADADRAALDLPRLPRRLRGEGADVAGAHLVAGRARRGAHRRLGGAGGHHAEDGRLRPAALRAADHAGCRRANSTGCIITLSLIAVVYIGFVALVQQDMKKLIAYSSIAHMGFVTLGCVPGLRHRRRHRHARQGAGMGLDGAMVQMISHGLISGAMFLCVGVMYDRVHSREISAYGGVINTMPMFGAFMVLFAMANSGLPGTSGFVGEFLVILAAFKANFWYAALAATTLILGAAYTLWLVKRVIFGAVANHHVAELKDLNGREFLVLGVLAVAVLLLGVWPAPLLDVMRGSDRTPDVSRSWRPSCHDHERPSRPTDLPAGAAGDLPHRRHLRGAAVRPVLRATSARAARPRFTLLVLAGRRGAHLALHRRHRAHACSSTGMYVADPLAVAAEDSSASCSRRWRCSTAATTSSAAACRRASTTCCR